MAFGRTVSEADVRGPDGGLVGVESDVSDGQAVIQSGDAAIPPGAIFCLRAVGEAALKADRAVARRIKAARFPVIKTLDTFRWDWPKKRTIPSWWS